MGATVRSRRSVLADEPTLLVAFLLSGGLLPAAASRLVRQPLAATLLVVVSVPTLVAVTPATGLVLLAPFSPDLVAVFPLVRSALGEVPLLSG